MKMAREKYVAVAADDWYQRRRQDAEGDFFRKVADQGPRKGEGGATRQGIYMLTADGQLLGYKNAGQAPDVMRDVLQRALTAWDRLPEERRKPGAVKVGELGKVDRRYDPSAPPGALIVSVYTRILDADGKGGWCRGSCAVPGGDAAARDHLWLTESDWKSLIPDDPQKGAKFAVPAAIAERIARFHLIDNTRGEPPLWRPQDIRKRVLTLQVEDVSADRVTLRLEGEVLLSSDAIPANADRGYDARLLGRIGYDRQKKAIDKFDIVALGEHWGEGTFTRNARKGRMPLGIVFELARGDSAADRVPPQGVKASEDYLRNGR
jgi:hypothetical protein